MNRKLRRVALLLGVILLQSCGREVIYTYAGKDYRIEQTREQYKKRTGLVSRMMYDFNKDERYGYRLLVTFRFTNQGKSQQTVTPSSFTLVDNEGREYPLDTEAGDFRRDYLNGPVASQPMIPLQIKQTYIVPQKGAPYHIRFNGWK